MAPLIQKAGGSRATEQADRGALNSQRSSLEPAGPAVEAAEEAASLGSPAPTPAAGAGETLCGLASLQNRLTSLEGKHAESAQHKQQALAEVAALRQRDEEAQAQLAAARQLLQSMQDSLELQKEQSLSQQRHNQGGLQALQSHAMATAAELEAAGAACKAAAQRAALAEAECQRLQAATAAMAAEAAGARQGLAATEAQLQASRLEGQRLAAEGESAWRANREAREALGELQLGLQTLRLVSATATGQASGSASGSQEQEQPPLPLVLEAHRLRLENAALAAQLASLGAEQEAGRAAEGHSNPQQKIQYHQRVKRERDQLRRECNALLKERFQLEQCIRYLAARAQLPEAARLNAMGQERRDPTAALLPASLAECCGVGAAAMGTTVGSSPASQSHHRSRGADHLAQRLADGEDSSRDAVAQEVEERMLACVAAICSKV